MTLGGLALAVGILVDDATVTIENINYHLEQGKEVEAAILDGAHQIALPALVSTLSICIVFVPMFLLAGIAKFLFIPPGGGRRIRHAGVIHPLAHPVPTLAKFWLKKHDGRTCQGTQRAVALSGALRARIRENARRLPCAAGARLCAAVRASPPSSLGAMAATALLAFPIGPLPGLGQDFFPSVDGGQIKLHVRAPHRHPHRGDGGALRLDRGVHPRSDPRERGGERGRQSGASLQRHQSRLQHLRARRPGRRGHIRQSQREPPAHRGVRAQAPRQAGGHLSVDHVRIPAGGHDQPDPELRPARPRRCADRRVQRCRQPRIRQQTAAEAAENSGRRGSARPAIRRLPAIQHRRRPKQGAIAGAHRTIGGDQPARFSIGQLPDRAFVLDRSEKRHSVPGRHADPAVPSAESQRSRQQSAERRHRWFLADTVESCGPFIAASRRRW